MGRVAGRRKGDALARKVRDGSAGNVPAWGYTLLARFPGEALAVLSPDLADSVN